MILFQKWNCSQDDSTLEHRFKFAKSEAFSSDLSPLHLLGLPAPVNSYITNPFAPENGHVVAPQQMQHPPLQEQASPMAEGKITLFHWQIQQETQKVGELSPERLNMQDADGDTYVLTKKVINLEQLKIMDKHLKWSAKRR